MAGMSPRLAALGLTCLAAALALAPTPARACGGFFCDSVNGVPTPVDQTGENILFVVDRAAGTVEAHIQIQYVGDPQKFAWIIPVTAVPDFSIGSEALFTNLLASTAPLYGFTQTRDCADDDKRQFGCAAADAGALEDGGNSTAALTGPGDESDSGGPQVIKREVVGAFEIVVLQGGTAAELTDWLDSYGYYQDPDAAPIVAKYLEEGYYFAAAKLIHGAGVDEIQPLVMTYAGDEPCVPLRLTRIAATEDMGVRVFALADARTVPSNYRHVELNDVRLDWSSSADNYKAVVALAIDTPPSDGQGFITEYAGPSALVDRTSIHDTLWDPAAFNTLPVVDVVDTLTQQNLMFCNGEFDGGCSFLHPRLLPLLRTYVPAPPEVDEDAFWACLSCYEQQIDMDAWSGEAFAKDFAERIVDPGKHAVDLLDRWPYLSRLLTVISPSEMTVDPEFIVNDDLPEVASPNRIATQSTPCEGSNRMDLPDGHGVLMTPDGNWPTFAEDMPYAARIEQMTPSGAPQELAEFEQAIDDLLQISNNRYSYDNGRGLGCSVRPSSWLNIGALAVILVFGWRGRRRRPR